MFFGFVMFLVAGWQFAETIEAIEDPAVRASLLWLAAATFGAILWIGQAIESKIPGRTP